MSVDILGTNCDQCRSTVQCCFTSTETVRHIRTESPGRPPPLSRSSWTLRETKCNHCSAFNGGACGPSAASDSYKRDNSNRCFNIQQCCTQQYKNSFLVPTAVDWNRPDNTAVYADSVINFRSHSWPQNTVQPHASLPLCQLHLAAAPYPTGTNTNTLKQAVNGRFPDPQAVSTEMEVWREVPNLPYKQASLQTTAIIQCPLKKIQPQEQRYPVLQCRWCSGAYLGNTAPAASAHYLDTLMYVCRSWCTCKRERLSKTPFSHHSNESRA